MDLKCKSVFMDNRGCAHPCAIGWGHSGEHQSEDRTFWWQAAPQQCGHPWCDTKCGGVGSDRNDIPNGDRIVDALERIADRFDTFCMMQGNGFSSEDNQRLREALKQCLNFLSDPKGISMADMEFLVKRIKTVL